MGLGMAAAAGVEDITGAGAGADTGAGGGTAVNFPSFKTTGAVATGGGGVEGGSCSCASGVNTAIIFFTSSLNLKSALLCQAFILWKT